MAPLDVIKKIGIYSLWDNDGSCPCGEFTIAGIKIKFECWRSAQLKDNKKGSLVTVILITDFLFSPLKKLILEEIGRECYRQINLIWSNTEWHVKIIYGYNDLNFKNQTEEYYLDLYEIQYQD